MNCSTVPTRLAATSLLVFGIFAALSLMSGAAVGAGVKVAVCHIPPDDPGNFHTIQVSEEALPAHTAHGDLLGTCAAHCDMLCDDGDACTIDECDPTTERCRAPTDRPARDCDDGVNCTTDDCGAATGCVHTPNCPEGSACDLESGECAATVLLCGAPDDDMCGGMCPEGAQCMPFLVGAPEGTVSTQCGCTAPALCGAGICGNCPDGAQCTLLVDSGFNFNLVCADSQAVSNCPGGIFCLPCGG